MKRTQDSTKKLVMTGMFTAVLAVLSQMSIPMPSGVPVTLQTFAVALCACVLGWKMGSVSVLLYLCLGAVGLPVFAGMKGGFGALLGATGGFLIGFVPMALLTGLLNFRTQKAGAFGLAFLGLLICHLCGIFQFMFLTKRGFIEAAMLVSVPYFLKDVISVILAFAVGGAVKKALNTSEILHHA
jgi:biotin transport system substrate-specific component